MEGGDAGVKEGLEEGQETGSEAQATADAGARLRNATDFDPSHAPAQPVKPDLDATIRAGRTPAETSRLQQLSQTLKSLVQGNRSQNL